MAFHWCALYLIVFFASLNKFTSAINPPKFIKHPPREKVFIWGRKFTLPCVASADPLVRYKWIKNDELFDPNVDDRYTQVPNEGSLVFSNPNENDEGMYQCVAYNQLGEAYSLKSNLKLARMDNFEFTEDTVVHVKAGRTFRLACLVPNSYPAPIVNWVIEKDNKMTFVEETKRQIVDYNGNLIIVRVDWDTDNGAKYFCTATNTQMKVQRTSRKVEVRVINQTATSSNQIQLLFSSPSIMQTIVGDELSIRCAFSGYPLLKIKWVKMLSGKPQEISNQTTSNMRIRKGGTELFFNNVTTDSEGIYKCLGYNITASNSTERKFTVITKSKPTWVKIPVDQTVVINESVTFECEGNGDPEPTTVWLANGKPIQHYLDGVRRKMEGNKIVVENVTLKDNAVFQCNISNLFGYIYTNAYLNVIRMVNNTLNPESREYGSVGQNPTAPPERPGKTWQQLEKLNSGIDDQNRILTEIRDHLKEFVNVFKKASFMKNESDD